MTNLEKYKEDIMKLNTYNDVQEFYYMVDCKKDVKSENGMAEMLKMLYWALSEYKEPEVDWSKVEVDTPILIRDTDKDVWHKRYFARYEDGEVYAWVSGRTSWSACGENDVSPWKYAKLAEDVTND